MVIPEDIIERLKIDFENDFDLANKMIRSSCNKYSDLRKERILRCVVFMSQGSIKKTRESYSNCEK